MWNKDELKFLVAQGFDGFAQHRNGTPRDGYWTLFATRADGLEVIKSTSPLNVKYTVALSGVCVKYEELEEVKEFVTSLSQAVNV